MTSVHVHYEVAYNLTACGMITNTRAFEESGDRLTTNMQAVTCRKCSTEMRKPK